MSTSIPATTPNSLADRFGRYTFFVSLVVAIFKFPLVPDAGLDASWRMVLGKALMDGWQSGADFVFTYGPLGGLMGNTYYNQNLFWPLLTWQLTTSLVFALAIYYQGLRLHGYIRAIFWTTMLLVGIIYADALQMIGISLLSFKLLRDLGCTPHRWLTAGILIFLALLGMTKFTNLILTLFTLVVLCGHELAARRWRAALYLASWFFGSFLTLWVIFRQNLLNIPTYLLNSLEISAGYEMTMGLATPTPQLAIGLMVALTLLAYIAVHLWQQPDRRRGIASVLMLGAFIYLNWKHSFIRSDGHMIGFFICALLPITAFPSLLNDNPKHRRLWHSILLSAGVLCLIAIDFTLPGFGRGLLGRTQEQIHATITNAFNLSAVQSGYERQLHTEKKSYDLPRIRAIVGRASLDVFGYTQAVALYNNFNYRPRPVFQSYSAYTPKLAALNFAYYASAVAPDYLLLRIETIDERYPSLDDSLCLNLITQRYRFLDSENGFLLWRREPGIFDPQTVTPTPRRATDLAIGQSLNIADLATDPLWATIDLPTSPLGRIRNFFYKPPVIRLQLQDDHGTITSFRLPQPQGRTGFILSPIIENTDTLMIFSGGRPARRVHSLSLLINPADQKYVSPQAHITIGTLRPSTATGAYFEQVEKRRFYMFDSIPVSYQALTPISVASIGESKVMIMHAPSEMVFNIPLNAKTISGGFGLLEATYTKGGQTDGAEFVISWSDGKESVELYRRRLDPLQKKNDQGLQHFALQLPSRVGGKIFLRVNNGPQNSTAWDWTGWTGIAIK
jgi:hypothetical protein